MLTRLGHWPGPIGPASAAGGTSGLGQVGLGTVGLGPLGLGLPLWAWAFGPGPGLCEPGPIGLSHFGSGRCWPGSRWPWAPWAWALVGLGAGPPGLCPPCLSPWAWRMWAWALAWPSWAAEAAWSGQAGAAGLAGPTGPRHNGSGHCGRGLGPLGAVFHEMSKQSLCNDRARYSGTFRKHVWPRCAGAAAVTASARRDGVLTCSYLK